MTPAPKLLGSARLKLRVALVSMFVLVTGWLVAPHVTETETSLAPPEERAAPLIEQQTQSRQMARPLEGVQPVRDRIRDRIVAIPAAERSTRRTLIDYRSPSRAPLPPAGFGVVISRSGEVLTHIDALGGRATLRVDAGADQLVDAQMVAYEPTTGLTLLSVADITAESEPLFAEPAQPGALVAAYFRSADRDAIVPVSITSVTPVEYSLASAGAALLPGTPLYSLAGELLAIATGAADRAVALPAREAVERLVARSGTAHPASLGVSFQALNGPIARVLGQTGALVADVVPDGPAAASGVEPGDVLLAVGDTVVQSPEAAHSAIVSLPLGSASTVRIRRDDRLLSLPITPAPAFAIDALVATRDAGTTPLVPVGELLADAALTASGVAREAFVVSVNRRRVSSRAEALRELRRSPSSVLLYLERDGERFFAVVDRQS